MFPKRNRSWILLWLNLYQLHSNLNLNHKKTHHYFSKTGDYFIAAYTATTHIEQRHDTICRFVLPFGVKQATRPVQSPLYDFKQIIHLKKDNFMCLLKTLLCLAIIGYTTQESANEVQAIDAIAYYSQQCNNKGGTAYFSNNQGRSWQVIQTQAYLLLRKQSFDMVSLNAMLNGVDSKQLEDYIANNRATVIQNMKQQRMLKCQ